MLPLVAEARGESPEKAWAERHANREWWYLFCNEYRKNDPARIVKDCLKHSDIICGVRDGFELKAAVDQKLIDLTIWVHSPRVRVDSTVTYQEKDCDLTIDNSGSIEDLYRKLERLAISLGIPVLTTQD